MKVAYGKRVQGWVWLKSEGCRCHSVAVGPQGVTWPLCVCFLIALPSKVEVEAEHSWD